MASQRYESVDCAKAVGIMLVVFAHIIATHNVGWKTEEVITSFHMPLFYVLSGMFFNRKDSFRNFTTGKINRLLVPFFFFFFCISVVTSLIYYSYQGTILSKLFTIFGGFYYETLIIVGAIWFLLSLFFVNIIFWIATLPRKNKEAWAITISLVLGAIGILLNIYSINLPFWLDTSLSCMPYFCLGYCLKNDTKLLNANIPDPLNIFFAFVCITIVILLAGHTCYRANSYDISIWRVFVCGILGTLAVFFISNTRLKHTHWLQFIGKNSIIILAIHQLIMTIMAFALNFVKIGGWSAVFANFFVSMIVCCLMIPVMHKYLPHVTGQKQLFR